MQQRHSFATCPEPRPARGPLPARLRRSLLLVALIAAAGLGARPAAAAPDPLKASRACRLAIVKEATKLATVALKLVDGCHRTRARGKLAADCNDLAAADRKGKLAKAEAQAGAKIAKKCAAGEAVRANFFAGEAAPALGAAARAAAEASAAAVQGLPDLLGQKARAKCHRALGKARTAIVAEILKAAARCQKALDKAAAVFGPVDAACVATAAKQGPKARAAIGKACAGFAGPEVGSCAGLPGCLVEHATAAGQALAAGMYAYPARPFDGRVAVMTDDVRAASAAIGPEGGVVATSGPDGTTYTLTVPPGALAADTTITLTPVAAIDDLPLTNGLLAAVELAPEGLQLFVPATLTMVLPAAVDPAGVVGFDWAGRGAGFGLELAAVDGATLTLGVTHFSGAGAGIAAPEDLAAIQALPSTPADAAAVSALLALDAAGELAPGPYAVVLRDWYDASVGPLLAAATASDHGLRAALHEWVRFTFLTGPDMLLALGLPFDLQALLGADGFALANRLDEGRGLVAAGLRATVARANAACLAEQRAAHAEAALRWREIAAALGVATAAAQLDLDTVLDQLCVAVVYETLSFPQAPQAGVPALLDFSAALALRTGPVVLRSFLVAVTATGATPPDQGTDIGTDAQGRYQKSFTPTGDAPVTLRIHTCAFAPGLETLSRVCQDAIVVRGDLVVEPAEVTLPAGGTQQFTAALLGLSTSDVTWSATGGTVTASGLFTAGDEGGTFAVTATSLADPSLDASAIVEIVVPTFTITNLNLHEGASAYAQHLEQPGPGQQPIVVEDGPHEYLPPDVTDPAALPQHTSVGLSAGTGAASASCDLAGSIEISEESDGTIVIRAGGSANATASRVADSETIDAPRATAGCTRSLDLYLHVDGRYDYEFVANGSGGGFFVMELHTGTVAGNVKACLVQNGGRRYRCVDGSAEDTTADTEVVLGTLSPASIIRVDFSASACSGCGADPGPGPTEMARDVASDLTLTLTPVAE